MDFNTKADIVSDCWMTTREIEAWKQLHKYLDLGFPLAYAQINDFATLNDKGKALVDEAYDIIVATLTIPADVDYADFEAMLDANIALNEKEEDKGSEDKTSED